MDNITRLQQYIDESQKIVFFGGAGVGVKLSGSKHESGKSCLILF